MPGRAAATQAPAAAARRAREQTGEHERAARRGQRVRARRTTAPSTGREGSASVSVAVSEAVRRLSPRANSTYASAVGMTTQEGARSPMPSACSSHPGSLAARTAPAPARRGRTRRPSRSRGVLRPAGAWRRACTSRTRRPRSRRARHRAGRRSRRRPPARAARRRRQASAVASVQRRTAGGGRGPIEEPASVGREPSATIVPTATPVWRRRRRTQLVDRKRRPPPRAPVRAPRPGPEHASAEQHDGDQQRAADEDARRATPTGSVPSGHSAGRSRWSRAEGGEQDLEASDQHVEQIVPQFHKLCQAADRVRLPRHDLGLAGSGVLVTARSGGIGAATARLLAAEGAGSAVHYHSNAEAADALAPRSAAPPCGPQTCGTRRRPTRSCPRPSRPRPADACVANAGVWVGGLPVAEMPLARGGDGRGQPDRHVPHRARLLPPRRRHRRRLARPRRLDGGVSARPVMPTTPAAKAAIAHGLALSLKNEVGPRRAARAGERGRARWTVSPDDGRRPDEETVASVTATMALRKVASTDDIAARSPSCARRSRPARQRPGGDGGGRMEGRCSTRDTIIGVLVSELVDASGARARDVSRNAKVRRWPWCCAASRRRDAARRRLAVGRADPAGRSASAGPQPTCPPRRRADAGARRSWRRRSPAAACCRDRVRRRHGAKQCEACCPAHRGEQHFWLALLLGDLGQAPWPA